MANPARTVVAETVDTMALDMGQTWDTALNWAAVTDELIEIIADIGGKVDKIQFAMLLGAAAMARRQSLQAGPEVSNG